MSLEVSFTAFVDGAEMGRAVVARLQELCAGYGLEADVRTVDVADRPGLAEERNIVGVPTVIRDSPPPRRRVIGALDDARRVAEALGLDRVVDADGGAA